MRRPYVLLLALLSACTTVDTVRVSGEPSERGLPFIRSGDLQQPYESRGLVQVTRRGVYLFGFADPAGTSLDPAVRELYAQVSRMGGDGIINVQWSMTQYPLPARILGALFFFIPLPAEVTVTGEVVSLRRDSPPPQQTRSP
jgi:hypothetical protein